MQILELLGVLHRINLAFTGTDLWGWVGPWASALYRSGMSLFEV